jgi:leucyl-tRNA synthetase
MQENLDLFKQKSSPREETGIEEKTNKLRIKMHQTIKKVSDDIDKRYHLNTAISSIMEFYNLIKKEKETLKQSVRGKNLLRESLESLVLLLSPFAPHLCEELWERMGHKTYLIHSPWLSFDPDLATEEKVTVVVQVSGKLRDKFEAERDLDESQIKEMALDLDRIKSLVGEKKVKKIIYIKNKLVNIVL